MKEMEITQEIIAFESVQKNYQGKVVLDDMSFRLQKGLIYCLIGESGSGKTTMMRLMNGLIKPDSGSVHYKGEPLNYSQMTQTRRSMGYALQGTGLFPHMTVYENITLMARRSGWDKKQCMERAQKLLEDVNLSPQEVLYKKPGQLSGGQKQRVGLARALFMSPQFILMDEPFGALDPTTREEVQDLFLRLQKENDLTVVMITHDLSEAFKMADEIIFLKEGHIEQRGSVSSFVLKPASSSVEKFLEANSPGKILDSVKVYSVVNTDFFCTQEKNSQFKSYNVSDFSKVPVVHQNREELLEFLKKKNQDLVWLTDEHFKFSHLEDLNGKAVEVPTVSAELSFLEGVKILLDTKASMLPVMNKESKLIGSFSKEALDAI